MPAGTITLRQTSVTGATKVSRELTYDELDSNFLFLNTGSDAVARTMQGKGQDIISALDFLTDAEKTDVLARTYTADVTTNLQKAWNRGNALGAEIWHP